MQEEVRLQETLAEQDYHYDAKKICEPITKAVTDTSENLFDQFMATNKIIEDSFKKLYGTAKASGKTKSLLNNS